jgi:hypothetical protein
MLDVSDEVRAEIGDDEADRLIAGGSAPDVYDCTSCRAPGDVNQEYTSTVLFVAEETAVLAFAHARCIPSQVVPVQEDQLRGAVQGLAQNPDLPVEQVPLQAPMPSVPAPAGPAAPEGAVRSGEPGGPAVLSVTCGLVLVQDPGQGAVPRAALVVEPTGGVSRPGGSGDRDEFYELLLDQGMAAVSDVDRAPTPLPGWSVLIAMGRLHAVLQPGPQGGTTAWWQAHQPLQVTDAWREAAVAHGEVLMYAAPHGHIGQQPREDLMRGALDQAAVKGLLAGATLPLAGT